MQRGVQGHYLTEQQPQLSGGGQVPAIGEIHRVGRQIFRSVACVADFLRVAVAIQVRNRIAGIGVVRQSGNVGTILTPSDACTLILQMYRPAVLSRIIHIENDALGRFTRHRPGGGLHYAVVGAEDVANGHRRGLPALREAGVLAHGVHRRALPRAYFGWLRQGGQRGRARHQQLQNAHAVAALGGGVAVGKGVPACAVLPREVKAVAVIIVPRAKAVLEKDMVGGGMGYRYGDGAAATTVGPRQRDSGRIGCVVGEVEIHFRGSLPVENVHPCGHIPMEGGQAFGVLQGVVADLVAAHGGLARDSVVQIE